MKTYNKNEPATIQSLFNSIASQYDKTNGVLSWQMHKKWNSELVKQIIVPSKPETLLDLCCGTGAIAFEYLQQRENPIQAYMLDFSEGMLAYAREQSVKRDLLKHHITYLQADAQAIPLMANSVDCTTIAYGIRNIKQPSLCFEEVFRVLRPGGSFGVLELTEPQNALLRIGHRLYLRTVLPVMGKLLTSNQAAYQYLCNSIHSFIPPQELERLLQIAGFTSIVRRPLFGGIATLLAAKKPF
jgi:demethylmenaquinone methyltransferase/2-methoxy-6-polyprenyl-1,4-benzoquinol methylase